MTHYTDEEIVFAWDKTSVGSRRSFYGNLRAFLAALPPREPSVPVEGMTTDEEALARKLAHLHFDRKQWRGHCPKSERTAWLVEKYWPGWRNDAREVINLPTPPEPKP